MKEIAVKYYELGLSVIPISEDKIPTIKWKVNTEQLISPNGNFNSVYGVGIVAGSVSGNLECIDIDCKYDLTGTLYEDYKNAINDADNELLKKLVVVKTPSGGYHFIYRCEKIDGNKKLAKRYANEEEKKLKEKEKVLIETRGEGGYFACYPTPKYEFIYKDFTQISTITADERDTLIECAKVFNEVVTQSRTSKSYTSSENVFTRFNATGDVEKILEESGWTFKGICRGNRMYLRPNGEKKWSAGYHPDSKLFRVFTQSSEFDNDTTYNPSQVLAYIKFNKDFSETAKWLQNNGYGDRFTETTITSELNFLASKYETDAYIEQIRNGTFQMGLTTGHASLDKHWLFKPSQLVMMLGHDNIGKSVCAWYFAVKSAKLHNWKWVIWSGENKTGGIKKKMIEYYFVKKIEDLTTSELAQGRKWFDEHFAIIDNDNIYTYKDMIAMGKKLMEKEHYDYFLIDPYNGLLKEDENEHQYDYKAMLEFRLFIKQTHCGIFLNVHAITEALRRVYPKGHRWEGHPMPPRKSDAEGGGKFCNKADDFIVAHRMVQHPDLWMDMELHIVKIKEAESGGKHTNLDNPVILKMMRGSVGYEETTNYSPPAIRDYTEPTQLEDSPEPPF